MTDEFPLDAGTMRFLEQRLEAMRRIESELNGALALLIEQNGLQGRWQLDLPGRRLVPVETPMMKAA